jgi:hypothetical protein
LCWRPSTPGKSNGIAVAPIASVAIGYLPIRIEFCFCYRYARL